MMIRVVAYLIGFLAFAAAGCDDDEDCVNFCRDLSECGYLPSPLGVAAGGHHDVQATARTDCARRCSSSAHDATFKVFVCSGLFASGEGWCHHSEEDSGLDLTSAPCAAIAECIAAEFGTSALGRADIHLRAAFPSPPSDASPVCIDESIANDGKTAPRAIDEAIAETICERLGVSTAEFSYQHEGASGEVIVVATHSCAYGLAYGPSSVQLAAGPVRAHIRLTAESWDTQPDTCWLFSSTRTLVRAGTTDVLVHVLVPTLDQLATTTLVPCPAPSTDFELDAGADCVELDDSDSSTQVGLNCP